MTLTRASQCTCTESWPFCFFCYSGPKWCKMAPKATRGATAPKAKPKAVMKAAAAKNPSLTATAVYASVAETVGLKPKEVKAALEGVMAVGAEELKKTGAFKFAGMLNLKLKVKPATPARKGVNPFTKEACVFKAKPASKTVRVLPLAKLKQAIN